MQGNATHMIAVMGALGRGCSTVQDIADHLPMERHYVSKAAARLIGRGLIERIETGFFRLTKAGCAFLEEGGRLTTGPKGKHTGRRAPVRDTLRQRAWKAMNVQGRFTLADLERAAARPEDRKPSSNLAKYVRVLTLAGYVALLPTRSRGTCPTSNGIKQFVLIRRTGPIAPIYQSSGTLLDHNTGERLPCRA